MPDDKPITNGANETRRALLRLIPLGVIGAVFSSIATGAFRFLRPRITATSDKWIDVAPIAELTGTLPLPRKVATEHVAGWAIITEEHNIYVLPGKNNQVVSAICPHEGCEVSWDRESNRFSCPCHESYFAADGTRLKGPARRDLDQLPARLQDGTLQVQYRSFSNTDA